MRLGALKLESMKELLVHEMQDLYNAEKQITKALPKMQEAAQASHLKQAFASHLQETEQQITRLEQAFKLLGESTGSETCNAMKGLVTEGEEIIKMKGDADVKDAALIAAAQRVEHYEMAGYGSAKTFAGLLGLREVEQLLEQTLSEEKAADDKLTHIATTSVNRQAAS